MVEEVVSVGYVGLSPLIHSAFGRFFWFWFLFEHGYLPLVLFMTLGGTGGTSGNVVRLSNDGGLVHEADGFTIE
jgi:hypothetical protein